MLLKERSSGHLVEVLNIGELFNLYQPDILGSCQAGEEAQDPENFRKEDLVFLSNEELPRCWIDPHYRDG